MLLYRKPMAPPYGNKKAPTVQVIPRTIGASAPAIIQAALTAYIMAYRYSFFCATPCAIFPLNLCPMCERKRYILHYQPSWQNHAPVSRTPLPYHPVP